MFSEGEVHEKANDFDLSKEFPAKNQLKTLGSVLFMKVVLMEGFDLSLTSRHNVLGDVTEREEYLFLVAA
jgi:hypothetical protein